MSLTVIVAIGVLGENVSHQRVVNDGNSAAASLAEQKLEQLRALSASDAALTAGAHGDGAGGSGYIDDAGEASVTGPYRRTWAIADGVPITNSKRVTVTVTHLSDARVHADLTTY